jgi:hypothetical protein
MEVSGKLQVPAALYPLAPGKQANVCIGGWVSPRAGLDAKESETIP